MDEWCSHHLSHLYFLLHFLPPFLLVILLFLLLVSSELPCLRLKYFGEAVETCKEISSMLSHTTYEKGVDQSLPRLIEANRRICTVMTFYLLSHCYIAFHQAAQRINTLTLNRLRKRHTIVLDVAHWDNIRRCPTKGKHQVRGTIVQT